MKFINTSFVLSNFVLPAIVGGIMVNFAGTENCVPSWLPLIMPCWVWVFIQWAFITALFADAIIYWVYPRYVESTVNTYFSYNINKNREERRQLRGTNPTIAKPNRGDLAYQMGLGIQEFGKRFNSIRHATPAEKKREYTYARETLNTILEHEIPKANLVFKEAPQIREKVQSLNRVFNVFGSQLTLSLKKGFRKFYQHPEMESWLWGSLENDRSLSSEVNLLIDELIVLLNQESVENEKYPRVTYEG